ncbi:MAG: ACP S-malonyltransferase [Bacteroidales bacterium]|nr:ACP S-malonyltransferase [Bacteroidales bacterium]
MKRAYLFPGQGAQFQGMGKDLYEASPKARQLFMEADSVLGYSITDIMFNRSEEELKQTKATQPAVFVHSLANALCNGYGKADMVAGHSLGEFSALCYCGVLDFEDALRLVYARAMAMQKCCENEPGTMAAVLALDEENIKTICAEASEATGKSVIMANLNAPQQIVISGDTEAVALACEKCREAGAKRAVTLPVGGAFHSPLMEDARSSLASAIEKTEFKTPFCPIYQNVDGLPHTDPEEIKANLLKQLTSPVQWIKTIQGMYADGAAEFIEFGPGNVLQGLVKRIVPSGENIIIRSANIV